VQPKRGKPASVVINNHETKTNSLILLGNISKTRSEVQGGEHQTKVRHAVARRAIQWEGAAGSQGRHKVLEEETTILVEKEKGKGKRKGRKARFC
jgi:hypothetical protein